MYEDPHWNFRSRNMYMYCNTQNYMHQIVESYYIAARLKPPVENVWTNH